MQFPSIKSFYVAASIVGSIAFLWLISLEPTFLRRLAPNDHHAPVDFSPSSSILAIYASERLVSFCESHDIDMIKTNTELRTRLEADGLGDAWYGLASLSRDHTGAMIPSVSYLKPGEKEDDFSLVKLHLMALAGKRGEMDYVSLELLKIEPIPERLMRGVPSEVMRDLLERTQPFRDLH